LGFLIIYKGDLSPLSIKPIFIKIFGEIDGQDPNYKRSTEDVFGQEGQDKWPLTITPKNPLGWGDIQKL